MKLSLKAKSVVSALLLGCIALISVSATAASVLRVGMDTNYPPFSEKDATTGVISGFDVDIANALCKQMEMECQIQSWDWDKIIPDLNANKFDAIISSMTATPERRKEVLFTKPYYENPIRFLRQKNSGTTLSKEGLLGKTIGVVDDTPFKTYAFAKLKNMTDIKVYTTLAQVYAALQAGEIQVTLADSLVLDYSFLRHPEGANFEFFGDDASNPLFFGTGLAIAVRKNDTDLADKINVAIDAIRKNGEYQKISQKYFHRDIYFMEQH